jgi:hypothetical protein
VTFAAKCRQALSEERERCKDGKITPARWDEIVNGLYAIERAMKRPRRTRIDRPRNPIFDALAIACGYDLAELTHTGAKTIGVAAAEIRKASPEVEPEEVTRRAKLILAKYDKAGPFAVSAHWAEFGDGARTERAKRDPYVAPPNWEERVREMFPELEMPATWAELSITVRMETIKRIA